MKDTILLREELENELLVAEEKVKALRKMLKGLDDYRGERTQYRKPRKQSLRYYLLEVLPGLTGKEFTAKELWELMEARGAHTSSPYPARIANILMYLQPGGEKVGPQTWFYRGSSPDGEI